MRIARCPLRAVWQISLIRSGCGSAVIGIRVEASRLMCSGKPVLCPKASGSLIRAYPLTAVAADPVLQAQDPEIRPSGLIFTLPQ